METKRVKTDSNQTEKS